MQKKAIYFCFQKYAEKSFFEQRICEVLPKNQIELLSDFSLRLNLLNCEAISKWLTF
jgi:hypothetical protein